MLRYGRRKKGAANFVVVAKCFSLGEKIIFRRKDRRIRLIVNQAWNVLAWETPRFIPLPFSFLSLSLSTSFSFASLRPSPNPSSPPVSPTPSHNRMRFIFSAESIDQLYDSKRQAFHFSKLNVHVYIRAIRIEFPRFVHPERSRVENFERTNRQLTFGHADDNVLVSCFFVLRECYATPFSQTPIFRGRDNGRKIGKLGRIDLASRDT